MPLLGSQLRSFTNFTYKLEISAEPLGSNSKLLLTRCTLCIFKLDVEKNWEEKLSSPQQLHIYSHGNYSMTIESRVQSKINSIQRWLDISSISVSNLIDIWHQYYMLLRIQLKLNTALLSHCPSVRPCVRVSQAWHLTFLTYIKA